jgi:alkanesulfonate monooxygenase SsuD/methylene tetrahydromethanopterin reductase-like flavin-dependent oxidoreductase (luciferase family)
VHVGLPKWTTADDIAQITKEIESMKYHGIFVSDSFSAGHDPLSLLVAFAINSKRLSIGTCVYLLPQRHPLYVAKQTAFLQRISNGRLILGVGIGWRGNEYSALGLPFKTRALMTDESLQILRRAWRDGRVSFEGKYFRMNDVEINASVATPPQVWVGGNSEAAMRRAAKAEGWIPTDFEVGDYQKFRAGLEEAISARVARDKDFVLGSHLLLMTDLDDGRAEKAAQGLAKKFGTSVDEMRNWALVEKTSDIVKRLIDYSRVGVNYHVLSVWGIQNWPKVTNVLRAFSDGVLSQLRR